VGPVTGSCLCGEVRFEVPRDEFRLLQGAELVRVYRPEGGRAKAFWETLPEDGLPRYAAAAPAA
jgi:hypothetical protein